MFSYWFCTHRSASVGWPTKTDLHQLCVDTRFSLEDLPGAIDDRDGLRERERERVRELCALSLTRWWWLAVLFKFKLFF